MNFKFTKERIVLCGLLGAAGVGLLADQFVFADHAALANEYALPSASAGTAAKPTRSVTTTTSTPEQALAARLQQLVGTPKPTDAVRDVFSIGPVIVAGKPQNAVWNRHVLNGILFGAEGKGVAIVDGRMIPVGSRLDGLQLVRVTKVVAVFSDGATEITLKIVQKPLTAN